MFLFWSIYIFSVFSIGSSLLRETNFIQAILLLISYSLSCPQSSGIFAPLSKITKADSIQKQQTPSNSRIAQAQVSQSSSRASSRSNSRPNSRPSSRSNSPAPSSRVNGTDESLGFQVSFHGLARP